MKTGVFGVDPELFVVRGSSPKATSLHVVDHLVDYREVSDNNSNPIKAACQPDGFALEFINKPTTCRDYIVPSLAAKFQTLYNEEFGAEGLRLSAKASMQLNQLSLKGELPMGVKEYGCVPDRNAYTFEEQTPEWPEYQDDWRYLGGHIHLSLPGFPEAKVGLRGERQMSGSSLSDDDQLLVGAALALVWDALVALPMVAMLGETNDYGEARRRTYYGRAGSHRVKPYGVEYRVLSGMILQSPFMFSWALGAIRKAAKEMPNILGISLPQQYDLENGVLDADDFSGKVERFFETADLDRIRKAIDEHDVAAARNIYKNNEVLKTVYMQPFVNMLMQADQEGIPLDMNFHRAWALESRITNHMYEGVEKLMNTAQLYRDGYVTQAKKLVTRMPQLKLLEKPVHKAAWARGR